MKVSARSVTIQRAGKSAPQSRSRHEQAKHLESIWLNGVRWAIHRKGRLSLTLAQPAHPTLGLLFEFEPDDDLKAMEGRDRRAASPNLQHRCRPPRPGRGWTPPRPGGASRTGAG